MIRLRTGNRPGAGPDAVAGLADDQALRRAPVGRGRRGGAGTRCRARWRRRRRRAPPPSSAPSCAAPSMPMARPLTTVIPAAASVAPSSRASASPCGVAARVPDDRDPWRVERVGPLALGEQHRPAARGSGRGSGSAGSLVAARRGRAGPRAVRRAASRSTRRGPRASGAVGAATLRCAHRATSSRPRAAPSLDRARARRGGAGSGRAAAAGASGVISSSAGQHATAATWSSLGGGHGVTGPGPAHGTSSRSIAASATCAARDLGGVVEVGEGPRRPAGCAPRRGR